MVTAIKTADKCENARHKKLLKEIDGIDISQAEGGLVSGGASILNLLKSTKGPKVLSKGGLGSKSGHILSKGVGKIFGKSGGKATTKGVGKLLGKFGGKSLLKKIPGFGLLAGGAFAADRMMKGDGVGAIGELASGLAGMIPGIGTAMSTAIDAGLAARDMSRREDPPIAKPVSNDPARGEPKKPIAVTRQEAPSPVRPLPPVKEVASPVPAPVIIQASPAPAKVVQKTAQEKSRRDRPGPGYHIPTEFDDALLVLMAHDRI